MNLIPGLRLGAYEVIAREGAGGVGEVFRARDTRLGREVAIKALPEEFARDPERLARFEREAQILASLNHPHIAGIHGLEEHNSVRYLVLEYVPGPTLADRVRRGPLAIAEALELCRQVADAMEAAHEKGIIHRDLKPANIKITPEGQAKVLDFGLAKGATAPTASSADSSKSPTLTAMTTVGVVLGTAAYMSPEQARGKPVDRRADVWAFGCLLYECVVGHRAFPGQDVTETLAGVVARKPDWTALPAVTPPRVTILLRRCLQKNPRQRLQAIGDARIEIDEVLASPVESVASTPPRTQRLRRLAIIGIGFLLAAAVVIGAVTTVLLRKKGAEPRPITRFAIPLPAAMTAPAFGNVQLSPDGKNLVFCGFSGGVTQLYLRSMDKTVLNPIPGTEGASHPFFSPDGQWIAFFAANKLKKVALAGGGALPICDYADESGGTWLPDGTIVVARLSGLYQVEANGGTLRLLAAPTSSHRAYRWPHALPGGNDVLFTLAHSSIEESEIGAYSRDTGRQKMLVRGAAYPRYAQGYLVFLRPGGVAASAFDAARLELSGSPTPIDLDVMANPGGGGGAQLSLSSDGTVAYLRGSATPEFTMAWTDRTGSSRPLSAPARSYSWPRLSPDGSRVAAQVFAGSSRDIWVYDIQRGTSSRLTFGGGNREPIWTADGRRLIYSSNHKGPYNLYWKLADGSGPEEQLSSSDRDQLASAVSPDGKTLVFHIFDQKNGFDIWLLTLDGGRKAQGFLQTQFNELQGAFSPDGRWLAYVSDETGAYEVYVRALSGSGRWQVSTNDGSRPLWNPKGRELFFRSGRGLMAAEVRVSPSFSASTPRLLFATPSDWPGLTTTVDGQRFLTFQRTGGQDQPELQVVLNWTEEIARRLGTQ